MPSPTRTPYAVVCTKPSIKAPKGHGQIFLTQQEYNEQMMKPDSKWVCPACGQYAYWDDDNYDSFFSEP